MKVTKTTFDDNSDEIFTEVELSEFLKEAHVEFQFDWGNDHAIIISFEELVENEEQLVKAVKEKLGVSS